MTALPPAAGSVLPVRAAIGQEVLRAEAARRLRVAWPEVAVRFDLDTAEGLRAAHDEVEPDADVHAVVVLRRLDLAAWTLGTCEFALGLDPRATAGWRRVFTRTVFLAGNPDNLSRRFAFDHVADDGSAAWIAPGPAAATLPLRRLLTVFPGTAAMPPVPPGPVVLPTPGGVRHRPGAYHDVHVATVGRGVADCLIALNHLLVEAVLDRQIGPGDSLTLRQSPSLVGLRGPFTAIRVLPDADAPERLHAHACLTAAP